jgi:hypothetical protein
MYKYAITKCTIKHHNNEQIWSHISVGFTLVLVKDIRAELELNIPLICLFL